MIFPVVFQEYTLCTTVKTGWLQQPARFDKMYGLSRTLKVFFRDKP